MAKPTLAICKIAGRIINCALQGYKNIVKKLLENACKSQFKVFHVMQLLTLQMLRFYDEICNLRSPIKEKSAEKSK